MARNLNTFPLSDSVRSKLLNSGFTTSEDLENVGATHLSAESGLALVDCIEILETVFPNAKQESNGVTALDLFMLEKSKIPIPTFCKELDNILGGGISMGKVTEVCGDPGSGKTQLCMQLCANVQIPSPCGGIDGEAIYIDTEGSLFIERLNQIADHTVALCHKIVKFTNPGVTLDSLTSEKVLQGIHYFHCTNYLEIISLVNVLEDFLQLHPKVSVIIIDSISFHFRYGFEESYSVRTRLLNGLSQRLIKIANEFNLAVVLTNQMTTRFRADESSHVVPALGESWGHACTIRLLLSFEENNRKALLFKSPSEKEASANFQIMASGIRDCTKSTISNDDAYSSTQPHKKLKIC